MRVHRTVLLAALLLSLPVLSQEDGPSLAATTRAPDAMSVLARSFMSLGGNVPSDVIISAAFDRLTGSLSDSGTIQILARGYEQTFETVSVAGQTTQIVFSRGYAVQKSEDGLTRLSLERSLANPRPKAAARAVTLVM